LRYILQKPLNPLGSVWYHHFLLKLAEIRVILEEKCQTVLELNERVQKSWNIFFHHFRGRAIIPEDTQLNKKHCSEQVL
jgi:hypothetical protein